MTLQKQRPGPALVRIGYGLAVADATHITSVSRQPIAEHSLTAEPAYIAAAVTHLTVLALLKTRWPASLEISYSKQRWQQDAKVYHALKV